MRCALLIFINTILIVKSSTTSRADANVDFSFVTKTAHSH